MYIIEKNIPVQRKARSEMRHPGKIYPFAKMEVGDSFLMPYDGREQGKVQSFAMTAAKRHPGASFTSARLDDGVRVWRVS